MKRLLLLFSLLLLLTGCGRMYKLVGKVVFLETPSSSITELVGGRIPVIGAPLAGARVTLFHDLSENGPKRDSSWKSSAATDGNGNFRLGSYAEPTEKSLVGLEVAADGFETAYTTYVDYADPDEQYFLVVLRRKV